MLDIAAPDRCYVMLVDITDRMTADIFHRSPVRDLLCAEERARLDAFKCRDVAWEYAASHAALRLLLARCLGLTAAGVKFQHPGEPFVPPDPVGVGIHGWRASLSHSAPFAVIGLAVGGAIGVDVEPVAREGVALELADQFLCMEEAARLAEMPAKDRRAAALRAWCLKEAALKAVGTGFGTDPKTIRLDIDPTVARQRIIGSTVGPRFLLLRALRHPEQAEAMIALALENESAHVLLTRASLKTLMQIAAT